MKKGAGYYIRKYFKSNGVILLFELLVVALVSVICSVILSADPVWLGAVLALMAYLIAEARFMMAYVAKNVNHDREESEKEAKEKEDTSFIGEVASEEIDDEIPTVTHVAPNREEIQVDPTTEDTPEETDPFMEEADELTSEDPESERTQNGITTEKAVPAAMSSEELANLIDEEVGDPTGDGVAMTQDYDDLMEAEAPKAKEDLHTVSMEELLDEEERTSQADTEWAAEPETQAPDQQGEA